MKPDPLSVVCIALAAVSNRDHAEAREGLIEPRDTAREHETKRSFERIVPLLALQGISDRAAFTYARHRPVVRWHEIIERLAAAPTCPRLRCWWAFSGCGYRKSTHTCAEPAHIERCFLPRLNLRKGGLNVAVIGLALFIRDVGNLDLVRWIDQRLAAADPGPDEPRRGALMRDAVLGSKPNQRLELTGVS